MTSSSPTTPTGCSPPRGPSASASGLAIGHRAPEAAECSLDQRIGAAYRTEVVKLSAQLAVRLLVLICAVGPFAFAAVLKAQSGTPADALFGAYVHSSGFAVSLVVMGFAGQWGFPLIAGSLTGDQFASEDRHNTWKTILTRSCSLGEVFTGKLLAAATFAVAMLGLAMVSSLLAGLILVGGHGLVDLSGNLQSSGRSLALTMVSWALCVLPLLAYVSLAALFSVASRNGIVGVVGPIVVALATTLLDLIGKGVWVHLLLIGSGFGGMYGLFTSHPFLARSWRRPDEHRWIRRLTGAAWLILRRRDFLAGTSWGAGAGWRAPLVVAATAVVIAVLAFADDLGPAALTTRASTPRSRRVQQRQPAAAAPDRPHRSGRRQTRRAAVLQPPRREVRRAGTGCATSTSVPAAAQCRALPAHQRRVRRQRPLRRCYKGIAADVHRRADDDRQPRRSIINPLFVVYGCLTTL